MDRGIVPINLRLVGSGTGSVAFETSLYPG